MENSFIVRHSWQPGRYCNDPLFLVQGLDTCIEARGIWMNEVAELVVVFADALMVFFQLVYHGYDIRDFQVFFLMVSAADCRGLNVVWFQGAVIKESQRFALRADAIKRHNPLFATHSSLSFIEIAIS